ncbi:hypothetical protein EYQ95_02140 [Lysobacter sp. N42]|nr:hypothetical protein EYQ95_02140 [Lysobacter sp. N42]
MKQLCEEYGIEKLWRPMSFWHRALGWMVKPNQCDALYLPKCKSIHTMFMFESIDLIWLDHNGRALQQHKAVRPWSVRTCWNAYGVIEKRTAVSS